MSIERMCDLAQVSRAGFYRSLQADQPIEEEMAVRTAIQGIAVAHRRRYGYRRITAELRRRGMLVNHKRVVVPSQIRTNRNTSGMRCFVGLQRNCYEGNAIFFHTSGPSLRN